MYNRYYKRGSRRGIILNKQFLAAMCAALIAGGLLTGCSASGDTNTADAVASGGASVEATEPAAEPTPVAPTSADFAIKLKVKEQQCFGSAGCNVTVEPKLSISTDVPDEGTVEITFKVSGDESGTLIETIEADLADGMYQSSDIYMSTTNSGIVPKAKITDVEYSI
jgi:hypothetical protein